MVLKEFIQMKRDRVTFAMMVGIPLLQLLMFGFAINSDPRHLPTAVRAADQGPFARTLVQALRTSDYFALVREAATESEAENLLQLGDVQFVINIPEDFFAQDPPRRPTRRPDRGRRHRSRRHRTCAGRGERAGRDHLQPRSSRPARAFAGEGWPGGFPHPRPLQPWRNITQYNVVPGLMGVVLTMI